MIKFYGVNTEFLISVSGSQRGTHIYIWSYCFAWNIHFNPPQSAFTKNPLHLILLSNIIYLNSFKHTPRQIPSYKTHLTHRTRRPSCGCGIRPGPCLSSSPRTTILCPRLPSSPPPPAGRCPLDPRSCDTTTTTFEQFLAEFKRGGGFLLHQLFMLQMLLSEVPSIYLCLLQLHLDVLSFY